MPFGTPTYFSKIRLIFLDVSFTIRIEDEFFSQTMVGGENLKDKFSMTAWLMFKASGGNPYLIQEEINETYKTHDQGREK